MHEGGGRWVGSNKLVELKKKKSKGGKPIWNKELPATKRIHLLSAVLIMTLKR